MEFTPTPERQGRKPTDKWLKNGRALPQSHGRRSVVWGFITHSAKQTKNLGESLGKELKHGLVIALEGNLGSGKTVFTQGLARGLGIKEPIVSPTFVLMRKYKIRRRSGLNHFCHLDFYRINSAWDLNNLNFEKVINDPKNIVVLEWPERVKETLPRHKLLIKFKHLGVQKRKLTFNNN